MNNKNCTIITSVISPSNAPLSYTATRSIYPPAERLKQTLESIESIKRNIPDVDVCVVECSPDSKDVDELAKKADLFINLYPDSRIRESPHKGMSEACMLLGLLEKLDTSKYETFFKLSGRYLLNENFDYSNYTNDKIVLKCTQLYGGDSMHTFFYKFPKTELQFFKNLFKLVALDLHGLALEGYMLRHMDMQKALDLSGPLGVTARWSCYNSVAYF